MSFPNTITTVKLVQCTSALSNQFKFTKRALPKGFDIWSHVLFG